MLFKFQLPQFLTRPPNPKKITIELLEPEPTSAQTQTMYESAKSSEPFLLSLLHQLQYLKKSVLVFLLSLPTFVIAILLFLLLAYNAFSVFCVHPPFPIKSTPKPAKFSLEITAGESMRKWYFSSPPASSSSKLASSVMYAVKEENPPVILKTHLPLLRESHFSIIPIKNASISRPRWVRKGKRKPKSVPFKARSSDFPTRIAEFCNGNSASSCKFRFFMTWISSLKSFSNRELLAMESLFKYHPNACLVIVSNSMNSRRGSEILRPFLDKGFRVMAIDPDFDYIFKDTPGEMWFDRLRKGNVNPGEVSLGQNLSNLLRLALLYKFGGIYLDTDVLVLKSFSKMRNVIGAQTIDVETRNWSRLNNAVLIFDKNHPLLYKFIEEFALTFDGNKWGHNGPYLVSRVVSRLSGRPGFNYTVLPPLAFYPVDWTRIQSLFQGPMDKPHSKWLLRKLKQIQSHSWAVHLWNRQSRKLEVEKGSIINHIMSECCIFCNSSVSSL